MSPPIISVKNIGKKYKLGATLGGRNYKTLRDTIAQSAKRIVQSVRRVGHGARSIAGNARLSSRENLPSALGALPYALCSLPSATCAMRSAEASPREFWALKDISFDVNQGEVVGIIGANGAGKSTLLKILSEITEPTEGEIRIRGRVASLLEVGTGFHPELSGRENVYMNGAILGMTKAEIDAKFDEIVAFAGVEKFIDTPTKRYSSGMQVRLAFAVAAHLEPEVLVVDEVLAVGDSEFQKKCLKKMDHVSKEGRTVLFVSHNLPAVESLCSKGIMLEQGRLLHYTDDISHMIHIYLHGEHSDIKNSIWGNTENEFSFLPFNPMKLYVGDKLGFPIDMPVKNDEDVWIYLEGYLYEKIPALTVGYAIYNEKGTCIYWTYQTDSSEEEWPILNVGKNIIRSKIPKRLLNEGQYRIELIGGINQREWFFKPGSYIANIYLTIKGGLSDSPYWIHKRAGVIAPQLFWQIYEK